MARYHTRRMTPIERRGLYDMAQLIFAEMPPLADTAAPHEKRLQLRRYVQRFLKDRKIDSDLDDVYQSTCDYLASEHGMDDLSPEIANVNRNKSLNQKTNISPNAK